MDFKCSLRPLSPSLGRYGVPSLLARLSTRTDRPQCVPTTSRHVKCARGLRRCRQPTRNPIQRLQQATHRTLEKLVLGWVFGGYSFGSSRDFTEVVGQCEQQEDGQLTSQSSAESLTTDLGTVIKLLSINILIQNNCSFFF